MFTGQQGLAPKLPHGVKAGALAAALVLCALLTALALWTPDYQWLACFSFLPLFVAVRSLRPATAALAGIPCGARLSFLAHRSLPGSPNAAARSPSDVALAIQSWSLRQAHPRAPPIQVAAVCQMVFILDSRFVWAPPD